MKMLLDVCMRSMRKRIQGHRPLFATILVACGIALFGCGGEGKGDGDGTGGGGTSSTCGKLRDSCMKDLWSADCMPANATGSCAYRLLSQSPPEVEISYAGGFAMRMSMGGSSANPTAEVTYLKDGKACNQFTLSGQSPEVAFTKSGKTYRMKANQDESIDYTCPGGSVEHYTKAEIDACKLSGSSGTDYATRCSMELPTGTTGGSSCEKDADCPAGATCKDQKCVTTLPQQSGCSEHTDCPSQSMCMVGTCLSCGENTCAASDDCGASMECANSCCVPKEQCTIDAQCEAWESCMTTIKQCTPRQCKVDADCKASGQARCQLFGQVGVCMATGA